MYAGRKEMCNGLHINSTDRDEEIAPRSACNATAASSLQRCCMVAKLLHVAIFNLISAMLNFGWRWAILGALQLGTDSGFEICDPIFGVISCPI